MLYIVTEYANNGEMFGKSGHVPQKLSAGM